MPPNPNDNSSQPNNQPTTPADSGVAIPTASIFGQAATSAALNDQTATNLNPISTVPSPAPVNQPAQSTTMPNQQTVLVAPQSAPSPVMQSAPSQPTSTPPNVNSAGDPPTPTKKSHKKLIIAIISVVVGVLVIAAVIVALVSRGVAESPNRKDLISKIKSSTQQLTCGDIRAAIGGSDYVNLMKTYNKKSYNSLTRSANLIKSLPNFQNQDQLKEVGLDKLDLKKASADQILTALYGKAIAYSKNDCTKKADGVNIRMASSARIFSQRP